MKTQHGSPARYWHRLPDERIQCDLCPRNCKLDEGAQGLCFVRENVGGQMLLTAYGRSSGFAVDPIEKKPLYHFLPGTPILSFGTAGCNLTCKFCQNWSISKSRADATLAEEAGPDEIARAAKSLRCQSVAFTYNDPVIFLEYGVDTAEACHALGIRAVAVTAGYISEGARPEFFRHMDAANIDLKGFTERYYREICGGHLQPVLETLAYVRRHTNVWLELTTLLIPGENDSDEELDGLTRWVVANLGPDVPIHFSAFHPDWRLLDRPCTPTATLTRARRIAMQNGLRYAYTGNVHDPEGGTTVCLGCGRAILRRDGFQVTARHLTKEGRCAFCGTPCAGVFQ